jgi:hypothetical protein
MKKLLLILFMLLMPAVAAANLYSGEVTVPDQSESARTDAIPDALIQVLQKLSGERDMPVSPALDEALGNAGRLIHSYRYKNIDRVGYDGSITQEKRLVVQFMQPETDAILLRSGLPRWQQERPSVQVWVIIDDGSSRKLKPLEYEYEWTSMDDIASLRGLPLSWPDLDEEEMQLVDMRLVWGGFTDYLVERGAPADGVAIIAARREGTEWALRWNLASGTQHWNWRTSDRQLRFALTEGIHHMTDQIASSNSIAASDHGDWVVDLSIGELNSAQDYINCLAYLQNLSIVTGVEILGANPGLVSFRLQLNASIQHLSEALSQGTVLLRSKATSSYDYEYLP